MLAYVFAILGGLMPALAQPTADVEYVLRVNAVHCAGAAPCQGFEAVELATGQFTIVASIDVDAVASTNAERESLGNRIGASLLVVNGRLERRGDALVFVVRRVVRPTPWEPPPPTPRP
jgi:hypothetical protein